MVDCGAKDEPGYAGADKYERYGSNANKHVQDKALFGLKLNRETRQTQVCQPVPHRHGLWALRHAYCRRGAQGYLPGD